MKNTGGDEYATKKKRRTRWLVNSKRFFLKENLKIFFRTFSLGYDAFSKGVMDVYETDDDFIIECDLPGLDKKKILD